MTPASLQTSVAEKIKALYAISRELEQLFPGRHYTPDGHMIGSIGGSPGRQLLRAGAVRGGCRNPRRQSPGRAPCTDQGHPD